MKKIKLRNRMLSLLFLLAMLASMLLVFPTGVSAATAAEHTTTGTEIRNDYLKAWVSGNSHYLYTTGGDPTKTSDNNKQLLYDGTSRTVIKVGSSTCFFDPETATKKTPDGTSLYSVDTIDGIKVERFISFAYNTYTSRYDVVEYKYVMTNTSASSKSVGARIYFDTMLGSNDSAPFIVNGTRVTTQKTYTGDSIPQTWQVLDSYTSPTVVATGTFYNDISERPDKVQFIKWSTVSNESWTNSGSDGSTIGDSAVNIFFDPDTLAPGASRTVTTYYGISDFIPDVIVPDPDRPAVSLSATAPREILVNGTNTAYLGNPFTYSGFVTNVGNVRLNNVVATLTLPEGLSAERTTVSLGNLSVGGNASFAFPITAADRSSAATLTYRVTVTADNLPEAVVKDYTVIVPALVHNHDYSETGRTAPTCTAYGTIEYACECGDTRTTYLPAIGHRYTSEVTVPATCTTPGVMTHTCSLCGNSYTTYIYAEHTYSVTEYVPATCTEDGHYRYDCEGCDEFYLETIPGAHDYEATVTKVATAEEDGEITYTCSICGDTYTETVPARPEANILLVQDRLPWTENVNTLLLARLQSNGYITGWDQTTTANFESVDLSAYNVIFVANDQTTATYNQLARFNERITEFATAGGVVVYGACDHGWAGGNISYALPGGVIKGNYYSYRNYIVDGTHNVVTGVLTDGKSLTDALLYSTYSSHTYFTSLPEDASVILADANGRPTLVEYPLGDGYVIASGLTWEYTYVRDFVAGTSFAKCVYDDLLVHAALMSDPCEHEYGEATVTDPTCTAQGYTSYTCSLCGAVKRDTFVDALGHDFGDWIVVDEATRTETGLKEKHCSRCEEVISEIIPVIDGPFIRVEAPAEDMIVGEEMTFILVIEGLDPVKSMAVTPYFDAEIFDLVEVTWLTEAFLQNIEEDTLRSVAAWTALTDVNTQVYAITLRAKALTEATSIGCELLVQDEAGLREEAVVAKTVAVITCPHTDVTYTEVNGTYHACTCDRCGFTVVMYHEFAESWLHDGDAHWHECTLCGAADVAAEHSFDNACDAFCNVCNYEREVPDHVYDHDCDPDCNECGATRVVAPHDFSDTYTTDYRYHWHACTVCGTPEAEPAAHVYDGICDNTCNVCSYVRVGADITLALGTTYENIKGGSIAINFNTNVFDILSAEWLGDMTVSDFETDTGRGVFAFAVPDSFGGSFLTIRADAKDPTAWMLAVMSLSATLQLENSDGSITTVVLTPENVVSVEFLYEHKYAEAWVTDEASHWHECTVCHHVKDLAEHVYDSVCDATCNECDHERIPPHAFAEAWSNDRDNHWHECELCDEISDFGAHNYGGDSTCDDCGYRRYLLGDVDNDEDVDSDDAIYLLYHIFFGQGEYPISQRCDFDGDGDVDSDDAIYLLYYIFFGDGDYPLHDMPWVDLD